VSSSPYVPLAADDRPEEVVLGLSRVDAEADLLTRLGMAILLPSVRADRDEERASIDAGTDVRLVVEEESPGFGKLRRVAAPTAGVELALDDSEVTACDGRRESELDKEVMRGWWRGVSSGARVSSLTVETFRGRRAALEARVSEVIESSSPSKVPLLRDEVREFVLRLRGICVASDSTRRRAESVLSARLAAPAVMREALPTSRAFWEGCGADSAVSLPYELRRRVSCFDESERPTGDVRGLVATAAEARFRRGMRVGV
jgi:hypothetical protein